MSSALGTQLHETQFEDLLRRLDRLERAVERVVGLLEQAHAPFPWKHLAPRSHPWRRQLYIKGRNMTARQLVGKVLANQWTPEEAARYCDLPVQAVQEALDYARKEQPLLEYEALYEQHLLKQRGYSLAPAIVPG